MSQQKQCYYCKGEISKFERTPDGKMKKWNLDGSEHTFQQCKAKQSGLAQGTPATVVAKQPEPSNENVQLSRLLFSQENKINTQGKKIDDFSKRLEQLIELVEEMYQQNTLIIKQTGYPKPEPVIKEGIQEGLTEIVKDIMKEKPQHSIPKEIDKKLEQTYREIKEVNNFKEDNLLTEDGKRVDMGKVISKLNEAEANNLNRQAKEIEWVKDVKPSDWKPPPEEEKPEQLAQESGEVINISETMVKLEEEKPYGAAESFLRLQKSEEKPAIEIVDGWTIISQRFECNKCEKITQNGYEKYGTMICKECREELAEIEKHHNKEE